MKRITAWKMDDGKVIESPAEAIRYDVLLKARRWYDSHRLRGDQSGSYVEFDFLISWLTNNREEMDKLLRKLKEVADAIEAEEVEAEERAIRRERGESEESL